MKIITGQRQSGKTSQLLEDANANRGWVICMSYVRCKQLQELAGSRGLYKIKKFITIDQIKDASIGIPEMKLYIDEFDIILRQIVPQNCKVAEIAMTIEDIYLPLNGRSIRILNTNKDEIDSWLESNKIISGSEYPLYEVLISEDVSVEVRGKLSKSSNENDFYRFLQDCEVVAEFKKCNVLGIIRK